MKLKTTLLVAVFASLEGTMPGIDASYFGGGKPRANTLRKEPVISQAKKMGDALAEMAFRHLEVMDLPLEGLVTLPSPLVRPDIIVYSLPAQGDFVQLTCFIAGEDGDVDLEILDADMGTVLCESVGHFSTEECNIILFPEQPIMVNVVAYTSATDATFGCKMNTIAEVTLGEVAQFDFVDATPISFYYAGNTLETLKCSLTTAPTAGGDIELYMYAQSRGQLPEALCWSVNSFSTEECTTISVANAASFIVLVPFNKTDLPKSEMTLNCTVAPMTHVSLGGQETYVRFEDGDEDGEALFMVMLDEVPSTVQCILWRDGEVGLEMYALGNSSNICVDAGDFISASCSVIVESSTIVIITVSGFQGDPLETMHLRCYAGPIMELTLGETIPLNMEMGDQYTFNFKTEQAPSQIDCQVATSDISMVGHFIGFRLASGTTLVDERVNFDNGHFPFHMGVFYEGLPMTLTASALYGLPPNDTTLECFTREATFGRLEWGVPTYLNVSLGDAVFFPLQVELSVPCNIMCTTASGTVDLYGIPVRLAMSPIGVGFEKTIDLGPYEGNSSLIWPWSVSGTTFHVLVEEESSYIDTREVMVKCDLLALDVLVLDEPVTFYEEDLIGGYKLHFLAEVPSTSLDAETAKVFYIEAKADSAVECTLENGEDVFPELLMFAVDESGKTKRACSAPWSVSCSLLLDSGYLFVSAILTNVTTGPDTKMTLLCTELDITDFPEEVGLDGAEEISRKEWP